MIHNKIKYSLTNSLNDKYTRSKSGKQKIIILSKTNT